MRRIVGIIALIAVLGVGSGGFDYAHQMQHQRQAVEWAAALQRIAGGKTPAPAGQWPVNGVNSACWICLILQSALIAAVAAFVIGGLKLLVQSRVVACEVVHLTPLLICVDCRGPPVG